MSAPLFSIVEGWSGALPFTLKADGTPIDVLGLKVDIILHDNRWIVVDDSTGGVNITNATSGQLEYLPASIGTFQAARSPYTFRLRLTAPGDGKTAYLPNDEAVLVEVNPL